MRGIIGLAAALLLVGCAANMANPATGKATDAEQCQRGGGWWRANLAVCDWQGTGTGRQ
jgi:hypothetical protein